MDKVVTMNTQTQKPRSSRVKMSESQVASQELFSKIKQSSDKPMTGRDVLNTSGLEWWADRYVDLKESLDGKEGAKYSVKVADQTLVSMYYLYEKLAKDQDKLTNVTSDHSRSLNMLNNRLGLKQLTESLNNKVINRAKAKALALKESNEARARTLVESAESQRVLLSESNFGTNITTDGINNPAFSVVDMVGLFFPGSVLNHMTDVVPLPQKYNTVYRMLPIYGETGGGVQKGDIIFQQISNGTYASIYRLNTAPSSFTPLVLTQLLSLNDESGGGTPEVAVPKSIYVTLTYTSTTTTDTVNEVYRDDGQGNLFTVSSGFTSSNLDMQTSNVNYEAVAIGGDGHQTQVTVGIVDYAVTYGTQTYNPTSVQVNFLYDYELDDFNDTQIRTININVETVQMTAFAHPLRVSVASEMEFEIKSIADVSILDSAQQTCVGLISMERDTNYISQLNLSSLNSSSLTFDASSSQYYPVTAKFTTFINTLMQADNLIKNTMGRGELTTLVIGPQARTILMSCNFFEPAKTTSSIGYQFIGTLLNGQVSVIFNPFLNPAASSETFIAYFKGFGPGDAPVIHGDWLPFYLTPEITMYDLNSYQAVASYYVQQINPWVTNSTVQPGSYVWAGQIINFGS